MELPIHEILEGIRDGVITLDSEGRIKSMNRAAMQLAGRSAEESVGKFPWEIFAEGNGSALREAICRASSDGRQESSAQEHFEGYCAGIDRWLEADIYPGARGAGGAVVIVRDGAARHRAKHLEEQLGLALSIGRTGVWEFDLKLLRLRCSAETESEFGLPAGALGGRRSEALLALVHPEDREPLRTAFLNGIANRSIVAEEFRVIWPDGSQHFLYARGQVLCDEGGEPTAILGILVDITEQKRATREVEHKLEQMQVLSGLAEAVNRAYEPAEIYRAAVHGLIRVVRADRAGVLIFDPDGVIRFKAWSGLSDEYMAATTGHSPWRRGDSDVRIIAIPDVLEDDSLRGFRGVLEKEGIRAIAFIPLLGRGGVIGKFSLYYDRPHQFGAEELQIAQTIAAHVAFTAERRLAEIALRDSEERFRATFFQVAVGITEASLAGEFRLVNDRVCQILGYSREELVGKTFLELTHPDDRETCTKAIQDLLLGKAASYSREKRFLHKNGNPVWARVNVSVVRDEEQNPQCFIGVMEDTSERIHAERALRESEQRLTLALSAARIGLWERDLRGNSISISPTFPELADIPRNSTDWRERIHAEDRERVLALWQASVAAKSNWEAEFRVVLPDGGVRWVLSKAAVLLDDTGAATRMAGITLDITERKHAEAALRESEELFRKLADTTPVMMWMSGPDKLCTFFNKAWLNFTGRKLEQELGAGWAEGLHPDDVDNCYAAYSTAFDARRDFHLECRLRRADGQYRSLLCSGVPRFAPDGVFEGYIGSDIDITDLKAAQIEAAERQKLESLGVLTRGIAHDFNNLLGSVLSDAELAEVELASGESPLGQIERIKRVAIRASEIVRELMIYSGQDQADLGPLDLSRLVQEMLELLKVSISKHAILKADLPEGLPPLKGNAAQIRQIVMNLIINASEALGEQDGFIHVSTASAGNRRSLPAGSSENLADGDYLSLEVADTGCGITEEGQAKIFDPFFTTKFEGRGLGLAVVQGIVRAHSGAIHVCSVPGQGTTFQIFLPCAAAAREQKAAGVKTEAAQAANGSPRTLLLVEDEETLRAAISKMLRRTGFQVIGAGDGSAAVDVLRNHLGTIDLILLDVTLPGTPSREVVAEALRSRPSVKIVLTSAYSRETVVRSMDTPAVRGFIRKPFQFADLLRLLREAMA
jgi:PAS domain S-box-containing protein